MTQPPKKARTKAKKEAHTNPSVPGQAIATRKGPGRNGAPEHVPTTTSQSLVLVCGLQGFTQDQIADLLKVSDVTLRKYYANELADAGRSLLTRIASNLASIALDKQHPKCVPAAIFLLKTKGGFREDQRPDDPDNPDEKVSFTINIGGSGPPQPGDKAKIVNA